MMLLCTGEDSILSSSSTESDVIMTSTCQIVFITLFFSSALLKTQMALSEKLSSGHSLIYILRKQGFKISKVKKV